MIKKINEKEIIKDKTEKNNLLIEGDNLKSLTYLKKDYLNKIDLIYIDPPYNTGSKKFKYKDKMTHKDWKDFMKVRLKIAYELLKDTGLIFISIDEYEFAQLKILCDEIFSEENFVENFIWIKNSIKNNSNTTSTNHEYILCYCKKINKIKKENYFKVKKEGFEEVEKIKKEAIKKGKTSLELENELKTFYNKNKQYKGISMYKFVDENTFEIYRISDISAPGGNGKTYDIIHPVTKKPCKKPQGGWRFKKETFEKLIKDNMIYFGKDETIVPQVKRYLKDFDTEITKSIIYNYEEGEKTLRELFNVQKSPFNNPKPVSLIKDLIKFNPNKDIVILDFFAGSGTTGQSVIELNNEDNGSRQFILCTNNENNICEDITYKRLSILINNESSKNHNLEYLKIEEEP